MAVFYVLLFVPILIQHIVIKGCRFDYEKNNKRAMTFFFLLLTALVILRHESVGSDTRNYIYYFNKFSELDWNQLRNESLEFGFVYFNKIIFIFSKNSQIFLGVSVIIFSIMIYPTYKRLCVDASLTIVLFCIMPTFVMLFSGIRQMLAIGIGVVAYEFTRQKKLIPYILAVILAMLFHTSAFMLAFMYPLYHAKITKKWLIAVVPLIGVILAFSKPIFSFLALILEQYTEYEAAISQTGAYTMLILFAIFVTFAFLMPDEAVMEEETIGLRNFLLFALVLQTFAPLHTLAMRMNYYYIIFIPLLMPKIIHSRSKKWEQVAILGRHAMVVVFLIYFFINSFSEGNLNVFPYHFFWENVI